MSKLHKWLLGGGVIAGIWYVTVFIAAMIGDATATRSSYGEDLSGLGAVIVAFLTVGVIIFALILGSVTALFLKLTNITQGTSEAWFATCLIIFYIVSLPVLLGMTLYTIGPIFS